MLKNLVRVKIGNIIFNLIEVLIEWANSRYKIYTLSYLRCRDILTGEYFQALQGLKFYVEFFRNK